MSYMLGKHGKGIEPLKIGQKIWVIAENRAIESEISCVKEYEKAWSYEWDFKGSSDAFFFLSEEKALLSIIATAKTIWERANDRIDEIQLERKEAE